MVRPTHHALWYASTRAPSFRRHEGELEVDVVVVGAGITGLTTALKLKRKGLSVALLERNFVGAGTSGRTTAHLTALIDARFRVLEQSFGPKEARLVAGAMTGAIARVEGFVHELAIACDFERVPGYFYAESADGAAEVEAEMQAARRAGLAIEAAAGVPLPFATTAGFVVAQQAQFQPIAYLDALAGAVDGQGSHVFEQTGVVDFEDGEPCMVHTTHGRLRARHVVLATHTPLGINALHTAVAPYRSYVMVVRTHGALCEGLFWDTASPYNYTRRYSRERADVVIVGGKDHKTGHSQDERESYRALDAYVSERFDVAEVLYRWSGQFYEPVDGLPFIGRSPLAEHVFVATGFSGDGMTLGTLSAMILADTLLEQPNPYAELFRATRVKPVAGARSFLKENFDVARRFVWDRLSANQRQKLDKLTPGDGVVLRGGKNPIAIHRDESGELQAMSAVCPHMKCIVAWNRAENTWDCPCHGARYAQDGSILEGPPLSGLRRFDVDDSR
ncbi:MAG: FAD-dependent oxidoreductase [Bradymonadaceae bacterium]|nr:FAD-dependent oxidoreductase [Lujinxingiaceae bacterium]